MSTTAIGWAAADATAPFPCTFELDGAQGAAAEMFINTMAVHAVGTLLAVPGRFQRKVVAVRGGHHAPAG